MAITVDVDVYDDVAGFDAYWSARNNTTATDADTEDKEKGLLEATAYLDGAFEWVGTRADTVNQPLYNPRFGVNIDDVVIDHLVVHQKVKDATNELAFEALTARLVPSQDRGGDIKRVKAGSVEVEYSDFAPSQKTYDFISILLKGFITGGPGSVNVKLRRT